MADILCKCICNVNEFTKAFNIMVGLQEKMGRAMEIIENDEKCVGAETKSLSGQLEEEFSQINKLMGDLAASKKSQFLKESNTYYQTRAQAKSDY